MSDLTAAVTVVLLAAHLLAVNVTSAAPLVCVWLHGRGRRGDRAAWAAGRQLARVSLGSLAVGAVLGAILAGLMWVGDDAYWNAVQRFPLQAYGFALGELAFTAICLLLYVAMWDRWRHRPRLHGFVAVLATTNLLYHFPPLMVALGDLASRPESVQATVVTRPVFRRLLLSPELLSQVVHFAVASIAVAGVSLMVIARRQQQREGSTDIASRLVSCGARIALAASLAQLGVGVWVLVELPGESRTALMGKEWAATTLFMLSIVAVFGVLYSLAGVALGNTSRAAVRRGAALMLTVVLLMAGLQTRSRQIEASGRQGSIVGGPGLRSSQVVLFGQRAK